MSDEREFGEVDPEEFIKGLRVSTVNYREVKGLGKKNFDKLTLFEQDLVDKGYEGGLPFYLSKSDKSLRELSKEIGVNRHPISVIYDHYNIPRRTQKEAASLVVKKLMEDPNHLNRAREHGKRQMEMIHNDPEIQAKRRAKFKIWATSPENRRRTSKRFLELWEDPNYRAHMSQVNSVATTAQWQDHDMREKMTEGIRRAAQRSKEIRESYQRLASQMSERWEDMDYRDELAWLQEEVERSDGLRRSASERSKILWKDPEYIKKQREGRRGRNEDPEFINKRAERLREQLQKIRDNPEIQERRLMNLRVSWDNEKRRKKQSERSKTHWQDPLFRKKQADAREKMWQDPLFRKKQADAVRAVLKDEEFNQRRLAGLHAKWSDPEFREKMTEVARELMTQMSHDPEHQKKAAEGIRKLRSDPDSAGRFNLPTIQGYRKDIGYHASSAWEANFARVLMFTGREFYPKESVILDVPTEYQDLFAFNVTQLTIDFMVQDPRGGIVVYDLIAHPFEDPVGLAKADMFIRQYPEIKLHVVDDRLYQKVRKKFQKAINSSPEFCGWEDSKDNLRINPEKYE